MIKLPEVQYQDEFYWSLFSATFWNVCVSPKFASERGHTLLVGLIFSFQQWNGGLRLLEMVGRWQNIVLICLSLEHMEPGSSQVIWMITSFLAVAQPFQEKHIQVLIFPFWLTCADLFLEMQKLYHVVFQHGYQTVVVYNNMLEQVKGPMVLLENHYTY